MTEKTPQETTRTRNITPFRMLMGCILLVLVMAGLVAVHTGQVAAVEVVSGSMEPAIRAGDRVLVKRFVEGTPLRNDIVVLMSPDDDGPDLVKRVVGLPGDDVEIRNGLLFVNGKIDVLNGEPSFHPGAGSFRITVPPNHYFVLGDNRSSSHDSTEFGPIERRLITGRVWLRYSPISRYGVVH